MKTRVVGVVETHYPAKGDMTGAEISTWMRRSKKVRTRVYVVALCGSVVDIKWARTETEAVSCVSCQNKMAFPRENPWVATPEGARLRQHQ